MLDQTVLAATMAIVGLLLYYLPVMKGPDAFFGIPVSEEFYQGPIARRHLHAYWLITGGLAAAGIVFAVRGSAAGLATPGAVVAVLLAVAFGPMVPLVVIWRRLKPYEDRPEATGQGVTEEQPTGSWRYVSPWVEVLLLAALVGLVGLTIWRYPALPERIPTHWNAAGRADGWTPKGPLPLLSLLLLLACMHGMFLTVLIGMARMRVRLPAQRVEEYRAARERYMRVSVQGMNALRFGTVLMFSGLMWASLFGIEQQVGGTVPPGMWLVWAGAALLLPAVGWLMLRGLRARAEMREIAGPGSLEGAAPTSGWIGGLIYYNRSDPALWVEKRVGIGWTLNFAHPGAWLIMGLIVVVPVGIALLGLAGAGR